LAAVCAATGVVSAVIMPKLNTEVVNLFLKQFSRELYAFRKFHALLWIYGALQTVLIVSASWQTVHMLLTASSCNSS
jgi:hypothetical protein